MRSIWKDRRGATAIEYGLIVALVAVTGLTAGNVYSPAQLLGINLRDKMAYYGSIILDPANR